MTSAHESAASAASPSQGASLPSVSPESNSEYFFELVCKNPMFKVEIHLSKAFAESVVAQVEQNDDASVRLFMEGDAWQTVFSMGPGMSRQVYEQIEKRLLREIPMPDVLLDTGAV